MGDTSKHLMISKVATSFWDGPILKYVVLVLGRVVSVPQESVGIRCGKCLKFMKLNNYKAFESCLSFVKRFFSHVFFGIHSGARGILRGD